jgi:hypothetical protein
MLSVLIKRSSQAKLAASRLRMAWFDLAQGHITLRFHYLVYV